MTKLLRVHEFEIDASITEKVKNPVNFFLNLEKTKGYQRNVRKLTACDITDPQKNWVQKSFFLKKPFQKQHQKNIIRTDKLSRHYSYP